VDFDQAILAHIKWKTRLKNYLNGKEQIDLAILSMDHQCELGKWIHGEAKAKYASDPTFADLKLKHAQFHTVAATVARNANGLSADEASKAIDAVSSEYGRASTECVLALKTLRDRVSK
jgi:methyl-accepting chemotaxis protein